MTGDVSDAHESVFNPVHTKFSAVHILLFQPSSVISVTTYSAILSSPDAQRDQFRGNRPTDANGSWLWFFTKLILFVGACAGSLYAYKVYALRGARGFAVGGLKAGRGGPGLNGGLFADSKRF